MRNIAPSVFSRTNSPGTTQSGFHTILTCRPGQHDRLHQTRYLNKASSPMRRRHETCTLDCMHLIIIAKFTSISKRQKFYKARRELRKPRPVRGSVVSADSAGETLISGNLTRYRWRSSVRPATLTNEVTPTLVSRATIAGKASGQLRGAPASLSKCCLGAPLSSWLLGLPVWYDVVSVYPSICPVSGYSFSPGSG